jgi:hypothetical protein
MTETKSLAEALAMLQTKLPRIDKANTADVVTQKGSYKYTYANLAQISRVLLPALGEVGLSFTTKPTMSGGQFVLAYRLLHVSGEDDKGEYPLPTGGTPQSMGSAITYARRYCLCAVTGVAPDDDDDDGAAAESEARRPAAQPEPQWERPLPEPETDWEWANSFETRVSAAGTQSELRGLFAEINVQYQRRALTDADSVTLGQLVTMRKKELEGNPE